MEFYEALKKRRTNREWLDKDIDFAVVKRILDAANNAPTWNNNRNWQFILLRTQEEKTFIFEEEKKEAEKFNAESYLNMPRPYHITLGQKMYGYAMPRQFTMLANAPYVIIPVFKCKGLGCEYVSGLNPFSTIWCVIENIFLAATAEGLSYSMRIPAGKEHDIVKGKLKVPSSYMIPVFIGIGHPNPEEKLPEQEYPDIEKQLHFGKWR